MKNIDSKLVTKFIKKYQKSKENKIIENAITKNGLRNASYNNDMTRFHNFEFSNQVKKLGITNQKQSGRCWIFAAMNMLKTNLIDSLNVETFELSQNYLAFYDKLEKANTFLELMIEHPKLEYDDRLFISFMENVISDGGYWEWVVGLIKKYGVVPKYVMDETFNSSNTNDLNYVLETHLISTTKEIKEAFKNKANDEEITKIKEKSLNTVFEILAKTLGLPPVKFDLEYRDKDKNFKKVENITPPKFLNDYVKNDFLYLVNIVDDPRDKYPKNRLIASKYYKSVVEEKGVEWLNTDIDVVKDAVIKSLQDNKPVWFDCDVAALSDYKDGIFDTKLYHYDELLKLNNSLTKADRVNYRRSVPTHAMTFVGVDLDKDGKAIKWEVENSWGEKNGKKGYFSMSDNWFSEYVFGAIVDPKYVPQKVLSGLKKEPILIEPWDPLA